MKESDPTENKASEGDFVRLFSKCAKPLYGYIASLVLNSTDTDEIFQETTCILWAKFSSYDPEREFLPWARGIAYFEVCSYRRKSKRPLVLSNEIVEAISNEPLTETSINDREHALSNCLERLPEKDSQLVRLRYYDQLSTKDISSKLGNSIYSVYRSMTRIHNSLLGCIEHHLRLSK